MKKAMSPPYCGRTIFAEDVRLEKSEQLTIVGVISGIVVESFPNILPKLAMVIDYQQTQDQPVIPVIIRAYAPGSDEPIFEHEHSSEALTGATEPSLGQVRESIYPGVKVRRIVQVAVLTVVSISEPGWIRVRGFRGDEVLAMGSILITPQRSA